MNKKLKIALKRHSSEQGFALPVAVGMGLIMVLVGTTMLIRGQNDQVTALAQKATNQGLGAAETGITTYQAFINKNRGIAKYPRTGPNSWINAASITNLSTSCGGSSVSTIVAKSNLDWQDVNPTVPNDPIRGQYRLVDYTYPTPGTVGANGTLTVEGRVHQEDRNGDGDDDDIDDISVGTATSQLVVTIPVQQGTPPSFGGVWISGTASAPATVNAHIMGPCGSSVATPTGSGFEPPTLTPLAQPTLQPTTPPVSAISLSSIPATLPQPGDTPNADGVYEYNVGSINGNNVSTIITPGAKVTWYLTGNITVGGHSYFNHTCPTGSTSCKATDFKILGYATPNGVIDLSGNSCLGSAFIFAPTYTLSVNGGGGASGCPGNYVGAAWVKNWEGNGGGSHIGMQQQIGDWSDTGIPLSSFNLPPRLAPVSSWKRKGDL